jgi:hypothetical protein
MAVDLDELWNDKRNWTTWRYRCKDDPRMIVPKRNPALGWTFNWAHPAAMRWFAALLVFALGPSLALVTFLATGAVRESGSLGRLVLAVVVLTTAGSLIVTLLARRVS